MYLKWFFLDFGLLYYACFELKYFWSLFHADAKSRQKQEKSAFHKLSDAIFRFKIAFLVLYVALGGEHPVEEWIYIKNSKTWQPR